MDTGLDNFEKYKLRFGREASPYRVFATWNIHYACNYKCSYCHAPKPGHKDVRKAAYIPIDRWIEIWRKNYDRYGTWEILISGGEPFTYPGFMELVIALSKIHIISVCTNLEWDVEHLVKHIGPDRLRIETSFHPEFADIGVFVKKLKLLRSYGFNPTVNFVPWPPLLEEMRKIKEAIDSTECQLTLQPFIGQFENRSYPQGYTEKERQYFNIFNDDCNLKTLNFKTTKESDSTKGKLCRMGQNYVFIHPDGEVSRCCRDHSFSLGNIIDDSFRLLEKPLPCNAENCNCWRCMIEGKEDFWQKHWGKPEINVLAPKGLGSAYKISLIQAPVWGISEPPVAIAQISGCLKKASYKVSVFDFNIDLYNQRKEEYANVWAIEQSSFWGNKDNVKKFFEDNVEIIDNYIDSVAKTAPDMIGFSVNVCSLPATLLFAEKIKARLPHVKIVLGGPMFFMPVDTSGILGNEFINAIVCGEGEETFCELASFFMQDNDLTACKGIYFKRKGEVVKTEARQSIKNLDELPFLDLESFHLDGYDSPGHLGRHISLMTSRGCVLNCAYCGPKAYWPGFRFMTGKRIYDEVKHHVQKNPGIEHIEFLDLELNGNVKALSDFCDLMVADPPKKGIRWHANIIIRPEMTLELMHKMKQAGCHHLSVGIETGSERVLGLIKKRYRIEDAEKVLSNAHDAGIHVTTNFMFGFPGETEEDFQLTLDFLRRNSKAIGTVYPSRTFFTIEPFSYVAGHMKEFDIIVNTDNNLYWESGDGKNNYPERLRRCEEFSKLAIELGVSIGLGLQTSFELDRYYNLGYYYESRKDFKKAVSFFQKYLELDPKNVVVNKKLKELSSIDANTGIPDRQISFNWDITSKCNFRCPYCWFFGKWAEINSSDKVIPLDKLEKFWSRMHEKHGQVKIFITGGEPFLYPQFTDLIISLSRWHKVEVVSNLSWNPRPVIKKLKSENIRIHPSFHQLFSEFEEFLDKLALLREHGLAGSPSFLAWPPQIKTLRQYDKKFKEHGIEMFVQPFFGEYNGVQYPDGYSNEEINIISPYLGERGGKTFQTKKQITKGKMCYAGCLYGVIHSDGTVLRCGGLNSHDAKIGNIADENLALLSDAYPCASDTCVCNEWAFLLKEVL